MRRRFPQVAAGIAVIVVVVPALLGSASLGAAEDAEVERRLDLAADEVASALGLELRRLEDLAADVAISTTLLPSLDAGSYETLLDRYKLAQRFPALNGITYVERIGAGDAEALLARREPGGPPLMLQSAVRQGLLRLATMSYPLERNRAVLGVDLTDRNDGASANDDAIRTGRASLSDLTQIVQLPVGEPGASMHVPVPGTEPPATIGMVFSVAQLAGDLRGVPEGLEVRLSDPDSARFPDPVVLRPAEPLTDRGATGEVAVGGQRWVVELVATPAYLQPLLRRGSTLLALGGIVAGLLVGVAVFSLASREQHARQLVAERTAEVRAVNAELATANAELAAANAELAAANVRLEDADRDKDDFLAAVSHELRTPLTVIAGFVESLRRLEPSGTELEAMLQPIDRNVLRLDGLVSDLLTLVSLDAGALASRPSPVPIATLLETLPSELAGLPSGLVEVEVDGAPVAEVDPAHLERILVNLLTNAERHGAGTIELQARSGPCEDEVELTVRDHGEGIATGQVGVVFERFTRAAGKPAVTGTGLGLAIVRELVALNGGTISYEDAAPGARFTVRLPAASRGGSGSARSEAAAAHTAADDPVLAGGA